MSSLLVVRMQRLSKTIVVFLWRECPPPECEEIVNDHPQKRSSLILSCRPQADLNYIEYVVKNWQVGVEIRNMVSGQDRDDLLVFRHEHSCSIKYVKQYYLEEGYVPEDANLYNIVRRRETKGKHKGKDQIVLSCEQLFDRIDEWHCGKGHMGQERTWTYCSKKYYNVTEKSVKVYYELCITCMRKNPVTKYDL